MSKKKYTKIQFDDKFMPYLGKIKGKKISKGGSVRTVYRIGPYVIKVENIKHSGGLDQCHSELKLWNKIDPKDRKYFATLYEAGNLYNSNNKHTHNYTIMRFVDTSIENKPYNFNQKIMDKIISKYEIGDIDTSDVERQYFFNKRTGFKITDYGCNY